MRELELAAYRKIVVLTGAGISAASGLGTYRGPGGLWEKENLAKYTHASILESEPHGVWRAFGPLREKATTVKPNAGHLALADLEERIAADQVVTVITQNVDGLHQAAGSTGVIELHGNLGYTRCSNETCTSTRFHDSASHIDALPLCEVCGAFLRPDIVRFGEMLSAEATHGSKLALRDCDLFLAVGTSGLVMPAASFVRSAKYEGATTMYVNIEPSGNDAFDHEVIGPSEEILPTLFVG